jgi:hypothetical protein
MPDEATPKPPDNWFRKLQDGRMEVALKAKGVKVRASGTEEQMQDLVFWFEVTTDSTVEGPTWKRPLRTGPGRSPARSRLTIPASHRWLCPNCRRMLHCRHRMTCPGCGHDIQICQTEDGEPIPLETYDDLGPGERPVHRHRLRQPGRGHAAHRDPRRAARPGERLRRPPA